MSQSSTLLHRNLISSFLSQSHNTVSGGLCSLPSQMSSSAALFSSVTTIKSRRPTNSNSLHSTNKLPLLSSPFIDPTSFRPIIHHHIHGRNTTKPTSKHPILLEWQDCTVKKEINVPISVAYNCYLDRESIPRWMPFISSVKILEDNPELSRWTLKYTAFGRDLEFSWLARNMQPIPNQKIHWRSLEGLPNRGAVRFFPKGSSSCLVELTVSYEVPQLLAPVAAALQPFTANLLGRGLERFANFARTYQTDSV